MGLSFLMEIKVKLQGDMNSGILKGMRESEAIA